MEFIIHRINNLVKLKTLNYHHGVEIDLRSKGKDIILNHDAFNKGELFERFLSRYNHGTLVLNIKEAGIEKEVIKLVKKYRIKKFFLLDVEFPFILNSYNNNFKNIALRISYYENFFKNKKFRKHFNWIWLDSYRFRYFSETEINILNMSNICFVCPSRWNKVNEIEKYKKYFYKKNIKISAIMTSLKHVEKWI